MRQVSPYGFFKGLQQKELYEGETMTETIIFTNGLVLDCTGREPQERATVVVEGDTIRAIETGGRPTVLAGATMIDLRGKTIMPGLIDAHVHMGITEPMPAKALEFSEAVYVCTVAANLRETLLEGFTTVRNISVKLTTPVRRVSKHSKLLIPMVSRSPLVQISSGLCTFTRLERLN